MKLFSGPMSMFGAKVQIAVGEKGLACETVMVPFGLGRRYEPKDSEVMRINPKGQVPVLIDGGVEIYDSTQIFEYLEHAYPQPALWPVDPAKRATARQLEHASDEVFFPHIVTLMRRDGDGRAEAIESAGRFHSRIDGLLDDRDWLAGAFGFADIAFFMATLFGEVLGAPIARGATNLQGWRHRMAARNAVRAVAAPMLDYMVRKSVTEAAVAARILA
jgi:glutathione S-transferase